MNYIRLKTSIKDNCIEDRLQYNPEIIEFHLEQMDIEDEQLLIDKIKYVQSKGVIVYLHHPMRVNGKMLDILSNDKEVNDFYLRSSKILANICKITNVKCVVHAHYAGTESSNYADIENSIRMKRKIEEILVFAKDYFLWEDTIEGLFSYSNPYLISHIIEPLNLNILVDVSHSFIALNGDNQKLEQVLKNTSTFAKYYHIVDSMGEIHDGLPLGKGKINWKMVKPYIHHKPFIFEIGLAPPYDDCTLMVESAKYYINI